jgi:glycosyltransferase involved in cell wall biosynthesis
MKKISIIIPCFNQGQYLEETLQSILSQTYNFWECLIVDDGSTDNTSFIAKEYLLIDSRFKYFKKENGGLSSSRNYGVKLSSGNFIQFLDSDDLLENTKLEESINIIEDKGCNLVISDFKMYHNELDKYYNPYFQLSLDHLNVQSIIFGWDIKFSIPIHTALFDKEIISEISFNEEVKAKEDWLFWIKLFSQKNITPYFINKKLVTYRIHHHNMTSNLGYLESQNILAQVHIIKELDTINATKFLSGRLNVYKKEIEKIQQELLRCEEKLNYKISKKIFILLKSMLYLFFEKIKNLLIVLKKIKNRLFKTKYPAVQNTIQTKYLENIFNTRNEKNVLVSYITHPFLHKDHFFYHSNREECRIICEILCKDGYNVDLVDLDYIGVPFDKEYDLLFGYGSPIEEYIKKYPYKKYKICLYRTGTNDIFSDDISLTKLKDIYKYSNYILSESVPIFHLNFKLQLEFADKIIVLGNTFVRNTYSHFTQAKLCSLDLMYNDVGEIDLSLKHYSNTRYNFLWFGSTGAARKGLDLCLQYFSTKPHLNLYIAGFNEDEIIFKTIFNDELQRKNIKKVGFVRMDSNEFRAILSECSAVIFPSIWEGGGGAVLNVIAAGGLIPIVTKNVGLDFNNLEFDIPGFDLASIEQGIKKYLSLSDENLLSRSVQLKQYIRKKHSKDLYVQNLSKIVTKL